MRACLRMMTVGVTPEGGEEGGRVGDREGGMRGEAERSCIASIS